MEPLRTSDLTREEIQSLCDDPNPCCGFDEEWVLREIVDPEGFLAPQVEEMYD